MTAELTVQGDEQGYSTGISTNRPRLVIDVNLILRQGNQVLVSQRKNSDFFSGFFGVPAGHLELEESVVEALVREVHEEIGIEIRPTDLTFKHVMHNAYGIGRIALFFECKTWRGDVENREPDKCGSVEWVDIRKLPSKSIPHIRQALQCYLDGKAFSTFGWKD